MIICALVVMVYSMLYHKVDPMIVLALLLCAALLAVSVVFIIDVKRDNEYLRKENALMDKVEAAQKCDKINGQ